MRLRGVEASSVTINVRKFYANDGVEYFISAEDVDRDILIGFLRLRRPSNKAWRPEIVSYESYLVRELHVYGRAIPLGARDEEWWQHRGIGEALLRKAEEIADTEGGEKILVMSGIGVREYYYRLGYSRDGPYVSKMLN
jgi:elongator complex protein 3